MSEEEERLPFLNGESNSNQAGPEVKVYAKRWYILAVFSILGVLQGTIWNSFGPITNSVLAVFCPAWTDSTLALLGNWGNIMYIIPILPVMWFFEVKGMRASMLLTGGLMFVGTVIRCIPGDVYIFTVMSHLCAILNGIAGIVIFSAPSALSSAWFPPEERTTATGIAIVFNNLGNALSFLMAPHIVPEPKKNETMVGGNGSSIPCPVIDMDRRTAISDGINHLMYLEAGLVALCFACIVLHFPSKPKHPPSLTSSIPRMDFLPGVKRICSCWKTLLVTLSFSLFNGLIASWYSVMDITFKKLPLGDDVDSLLGYIGCWAIVGNSVAAIGVSRIVDKLRGRMKRTLMILMITACCFWVWLGLICLEVVPFQLWELYLTVICASALTYASGPIFFEFTVEIIYPVPEGIVGGFLTCVYNSVGMIFLFLFYIPGLKDNPDWIPYAIMLSTCVSVPLVLMVKEEHNRSDIDGLEGSNHPSAYGAI